MKQMKFQNHYEINNHSIQYLYIFAFFLKVFYAPHPGRFPGEHSLNAAGHSNGLPKEARLTTVTTVLENLRKFSNYTLQVLSFTDAGDGQLSKIISCLTKLLFKRFLFDIISAGQIFRQAKSYCSTTFFVGKNFWRTKYFV